MCSPIWVLVRSNLALRIPFWSMVVLVSCNWTISSYKDTQLSCIFENFFPFHHNPSLEGAPVLSHFGVPRTLTCNAQVLDQLK